MITTTEKKRRGRPPKGESISIHNQIVNLGKNTKNLPMREIAETVGVSINTVSDVLAKYQINQQELEDYRNNQADILLGLQHRITKHITDESIKRAPMRDQLVALGIAIDKHRLVTGQSTSNVSNWTMIVNKASKPTKEEIVVNPSDETVP